MEEIGLGGRLQGNANWAPADIAALAAEPSLRILQYSEQEVPDAERLDALNSLFAARPDVELRLYGFHLRPADLSVLKRLPEVQKLSVDCCSRVENLGALGGLAKLRELTLDVFELDSFDVLGEVRSGLDCLALGKTRSKKPDLSVLRRFAGLERLSLAGQRKHLDVLHVLGKLRELTVYGVPLGDLSFLGGNPELAELSLGFGGAEELDGLRAAERLERLSLTSVRGLKRLDVLAALPRLRELKLRNQPKLAALPDLSGLPHLRAIECYEVALESLGWASTAPGLDQLALLDVKTLEAGDFAKLLAVCRPPRIRVSMLRAAQREAVSRLLAQTGYVEGKRNEWRMPEVGRNNARQSRQG